MTGIGTSMSLEFSLAGTSQKIWDPSEISSSKQLVFVFAPCKTCTSGYSNRIAAGYWTCLSGAD